MTRKGINSDERGNNNQTPKNSICWNERRVKLVKDCIKSFLEKYQNTPRVEIHVQEFTILQLQLQEFNSITEKENTWVFIAVGEITKKDISGVVTSSHAQIIGNAVIEWYPNKIYDKGMLEECPELPNCIYITLTKLNYSI